jgi:transcriptional regulator with XRE-family HTH domain
MTTLGERTRQRRKELGISQKTLAQRVNVKQTSIYLIEKGETENPRFMLALAAALDTTAQWLLGQEVLPVQAGQAPAEPVAMVGHVAGQEVQAQREWEESRWQWLLMPRDRRYPGVTRKLYEVRGDAFDEVFPAGTIIIVADYSALGRKPQAGDRCLVAKQHDGDGFELRIKEVQGDGDKQFLRSRSTNPDYLGSWKIDPVSKEF